MNSKQSTKVVNPKKFGIEAEDIKSAFNIQHDNKNSLNLGLMILNQIGSTYTGGNDENTIANIIASVDNLKPMDHIESMLVAQMLVTHNATMSNFSRATQYCASGNFKTMEAGNAALNLANKLVRTYTMQIEALNRYRGKGQQKMTIEHVHINSGGQAIIGNVTKNNIAEEKEKTGGN